uniref:Transmembrane protein n=1 Tax=Glossina palpalis gambiensis TaxID=67801 RepID=A0A1B0B149_9MUSC
MGKPKQSSSSSLFIYFVLVLSLLSSLVALPQPKQRNANAFLIKIDRHNDFVSSLRIRCHMTMMYLSFNSFFFNGQIEDFNCSKLRKAKGRKNFIIADSEKDDNDNDDDDNDDDDDDYEEL